MEAISMASEQDVDDSEQVDPRLVEVVMASADDLMCEGGILHRYDQDACCHRETARKTTTDLTTAAVLDGRSLCEDCDWPDGAKEVLRQ